MITADDSGLGSAIIHEPLLVLSDFNIDVLIGLFNNDSRAPQVRAQTAGFGNVVGALLDETSAVWKGKPSALVWMRPEGVSDTFAKALLMEAVDVAEALQDVDRLCDAILSASRRAKALFVASWQISGGARGYGMIDLQPGLGVRFLLAAMNDRLVQRLSGQAGIYVLDSARWFQCREPFSTKLWYLAKIPYSNDVFKSALGDVKSAFRGLQGQARKVVICDLDDTLWGGIVGDTGWENLRIGGHDAIGEALADFQRELKALSRRGVILAIVSKNTESIALEAIDLHPEMILRRKDFAGWRINWKDKAQNIVDLMQELNLGLQSAVFLDDNPVERARVAESLPELLVPELPKDQMLYIDALRRLDCFDTPILSKEDRQRTAMYSVARERNEAIKQQGNVSSLDDWLQTLDLTVHAELINESNCQRVSQLLNKTNQMNLKTRRMTEGELISWAKPENHQVWAFRVSDKFGDSGLAGIASLEIDGELAYIEDFILSCRVMGKRVENTMLHHMVNCAASLGATRVIAQYLPTSKNMPCLEFFERSGFESSEGSSFAWDASIPYGLPPGIKFFDYPPQAKILGPEENLP
jgi:FkbH-like protein